jgi:hypothetical protein
MRNSWIILFLFYTQTLWASGDVVYDVYGGKTWALRQMYRETIVKQLNENVETTFQWFAFNDSVQPGIARLNRNLQQLATADWLKDPIYAQLLTDFRNRMKVQREIYYSRSDNDYRNEWAEDPYPKVQEMEVKALVVNQNRVWLELVFTSETGGRSREDLQVRYYYQGNLLTGELRRMSFDQVYYNRQALAQLLAPLFTQQYFVQTEKLSERDKRRRFPANISDVDGRRTMIIEDEDDNTARAEDNEDDEFSYSPSVKLSSKDSADICADLCVHLEFRELDFYRYGWGVMVGFQEATASSRVYDGASFYLFLDGKNQQLFSEIVRLPELAPPAIPPVHHFKNFSYFRLTDGFSMLRNAPDIYRLIDQQRKADMKIHVLVTESYQLFKNDTRNYRGRFISLFNRDGKMVRKIFLDEKADTVLDVRSVYNADGRLTGLYGFGYRREAENKSYRYDDAGNLVFYEEQDGRERRLIRYFYNGHSMFSFSSSGKEAPGEQLSEMSFEGNECCFRTACYKLNDQWQPVMQTKRKYAHEEVHIGRDTAGNLVEVHAENDRYNYYFEYDSFRRFHLFSAYEETKPLVRLTYFYKDDNLLPYEQLKVSLHSGQEIIEKEVYTWENY